MLRAHKHLTKKELKKDPFLIFVAQATDYVQREWIKLVSTVLAVIVVVSVALIIVNGSERAERTAYDRAVEAYYTGAPESIDLLAQYADKYSSSKRAVQVMLQLANYYIAQNDYDSAEKYYLACTREVSGDQIFGYNAFNGLGAVYEEQGQFAQAGEIYEQFLQKFTHSPFTDMMLFNAGKAYLSAGNTAAAERNFSAILDATSDSELKQEAQYYLELLS